MLREAKLELWTRRAVEALREARVFAESGDVEGALVKASVAVEALRVASVVEGGEG